jgi:hypothetical protein
MLVKVGKLYMNPMFVNQIGVSQDDGKNMRFDIIGNDGKIINARSTKQEFDGLIEAVNREHRRLEP